MSLLKNVKNVMMIINKAIMQTPLDKRPFLMSKLNKIANKYENLDP